MKTGGCRIPKATCGTAVHAKCAKAAVQVRCFVENSNISNLNEHNASMMMSTRQTKTFAKINNIIKCKPYNGYFINKTPKNSHFGNFVIIFKPVLYKIGNFVIKNASFDPFLALAKNLTRWSRPNERTDKKSQGRPFDRLRDLNQQRLNN